jgi:hypothetical protein
MLHRTLTHDEIIVEVKGGLVDMKTKPLCNAERKLLPDIPFNVQHRVAAACGWRHSVRERNHQSISEIPGTHAHTPHIFSHKC